MQTRREIEELLTAAGIRPLKRFGQNFLIDHNLMNKLVAAAEIGPSDTLLEVGPGTGSLTEKLLEVSAHVVAVEIDRGLQSICRSRFDGSSQFTLIGRDILDRKSAIAPQVLNELREQQRELGGRILLLSNLPYQVSAPVVINLLLGDLPVSPMCFTIQAEVADRITARPGGKEYGPISVIAQALGQVRRIARVPPQAFWPEPKVHSTMLRLDRRTDRPPEDVVQTLIRLVHGCFGHRRKTMRSNLRTLLNQQEISRVELDGRWDLSLRPEQLTVEQWLQLAESINLVGID